MSTFEIITVITTIVFGVIAAWQGYLNHKTQKANTALEETVRQLRLFDQDTALNMFLAARNHEMQIWNLWQTLESTFSRKEAIDPLLIGWAGKAHGEAEEIARTMIRVYRLSGAIPTESQVDSWIKDGLIPEHYKPWIMSYVRK